MNKKTPQTATTWRVLEQGGLVPTLALFSLVGKNAGVRAMDLSMLVFACHCLFVRRIAYGVEGQDPIGYLTGVLAIFMILKPALMLDIFS
ncbi:hypothetical protein [Undibacterium sp. Tian12W]|uniref:hypothetical protein n=1 Tax=Undibacterium sp. Tian12W TaxID=3413054 RepID=UPI003BF165D5